MASQKYIDAIRHIFANEQEVQDFLDAIDKPIPKSCKIMTSRIRADFFCELIELAGWETYETKFGGLCSDMRYLHKKKQDETGEDETKKDKTDETISCCNENQLTRQPANQKTLAAGKTIPHLIGLCYLQEAAAALPAHLVPITPDALILDMCAAPGGKSVQLADALLQTYPDQPGCIRGNDPDPKRLQTRGTNIERMGCYNTIATCMDATKFGDLTPETFDAILLDAPCSGEGTSFKSDSALARRHPEEVRKIAGLQRQLLHSAVKACKIGGTILYSTCTMNQRENEENIAYILAQYPEILELEQIDMPGTARGIKADIASKVIRCRPHRQHTGGFFVAKLKKIGKTQRTKETNTEKQKSRRDQSGTEKAKVVSVKTISDYCQTTFGINSFSNHYHYIQTGDIISLLSSKVYEAYQLARSIHGMRLTFYGLPILKTTKNQVRPLHSFAPTLGRFATKNIIELNDATMQHYVLHEDIPIVDIQKTTNLPESTEPSGILLIRWRDRMCGITKVVNGVLKNKFFKW